MTFCSTEDGESAGLCPLGSASPGAEYLGSEKSQPRGRPFQPETLGGTS